MNGLICSSGGQAYKINVTDALTEIVSPSPSYKYIRITNLGSSAVYLGPVNSDLEAETGIVLEPYGNANDYIEFNNTNMFYCGLVGITASGNSDVAVLIGI